MSSSFFGTAHIEFQTLQNHCKGLSYAAAPDARSPNSLCLDLLSEIARMNLDDRQGYRFQVRNSLVIRNSTACGTIITIEEFRRENGPESVLRASIIIIKVS